MYQGTSVWGKLWHQTDSMWFAISSGENCLDRGDICTREEQGLLGNQNPGASFPGHRRPDFSLFSSSLLRTWLSKFITCPQQQKLVPSLHLGTTKRGTALASNKGQGKDGESTKERNQNLLSNCYVPSTMLSA